MIPSIHNTTAGVKFRSHLEGRWSIALDCLGIPWAYEPQRIRLESGVYIPDFLLADRVWLEIKPQDFPERALMRCGELNLADSRPVLLIAGDFTTGFKTYSWPQCGTDQPQEILLSLFGATGWAAACRKAREHKFEKQGKRPYTRSITEGNYTP